MVGTESCAGQRNLKRYCATVRVGAAPCVGAGSERPAQAVGIAPRIPFESENTRRSTHAPCSMLHARARLPWRGVSRPLPALSYSGPPSRARFRHASRWSCVMLCCRPPFVGCWRFTWDFQYSAFRSCVLRCIDQRISRHNFALGPGWTAVLPRRRP